jgi:hypothetical protein
MARIAKFFGRHWDLDKIISITDPEFPGGNVPCITVDAQLRDKPIHLYESDFWTIDGVSRMATCKDYIREEHVRFIAAWRES